MFRDDPLSGKLNWVGKGGPSPKRGHGPLGAAADDESSTTNGAKVDVFVEQ